MNLSTAERCAFVKNTADCSLEDGFINYLRVAFCLLPSNLTPLTVTLCVRSACLSVYVYVEWGQLLLNGMKLWAHHLRKFTLLWGNLNDHTFDLQGSVISVFAKQWTSVKIWYTWIPLFATWRIKCHCGCCRPTESVYVNKDRFFRVTIIVYGVRWSETDSGSSLLWVHEKKATDWISSASPQMIWLLVLFVFLGLTASKL